MNVFMLFYIFIFSFQAFANQRVPGFTEGGRGKPRDDLWGLRRKGEGGESGEGGKGLAGMRVGSCFARFRMTRARWNGQRWNGQLKTMGDLSKIKPIWRCHDHIRQAAAR